MFGYLASWMAHAHSLGSVYTGHTLAAAGRTVRQSFIALKKTEVLIEPFSDSWERVGKVRPSASDTSRSMSAISGRILTGWNASKRVSARFFFPARLQSPEIETSTWASVSLGNAMQCAEGLCRAHRCVVAPLRHCGYSRAGFRLSGAEWSTQKSHCSPSKDNVLKYNFAKCGSHSYK